MNPSKGRKGSACSRAPLIASTSTTAPVAIDNTSKSNASPPSVKAILFARSSFWTCADISLAPRGLRQRREFNRQFFQRVVTRNPARQHAAVSQLGRRRDENNVDAWVVGAVPDRATRAHAPARRRRAAAASPQATCATLKEPSVHRDSRCASRCGSAPKKYARRKRHIRTIVRQIPCRCQRRPDVTTRVLIAAGRDRRLARFENSMSSINAIGAKPDNCSNAERVTKIA